MHSFFSHSRQFLRTNRLEMAFHLTEVALLAEGRTLLAPSLRMAGSVASGTLLIGRLGLRWLNSSPPLELVDLQSGSLHLSPFPASSFVRPHEIWDTIEML